jgi:hypothetical protein
MALTRMSSGAPLAPATAHAARFELGRGPWLEELLECSEAMEAVRRDLLGWKPDLASTTARTGAPTRRQPAGAGPDRAAQLLQDGPVMAFRAAAERIDAWAASTEPLAARRTGLMAGSLGVELQLSGVRLELAVRLRHSQPVRAARASERSEVAERLSDVAGVGSTSAATGSAIVRRVVEHPRGSFADDVETARRGLNLVQVLHRLLQTEVPDPDID